MEGINGYAKIRRFSSREIGYIAISPGQGRWGGRRILLYNKFFPV